MTDKSKTQQLADKDLDDVQGGLNYEKIEWTVKGKTDPKRREGYNGQQGDEGAMIKSDKPIVASGGGNDI